MKHQMSYSIRPKKTGNEKRKKGKKEHQATIIVHKTPILSTQETSKTYTEDLQRIPIFDPNEIKNLLGSNKPHKPRNYLKTVVVIGVGITVGLLFGYALLNTFIKGSTSTIIPKPASNIVQPSNGKTTINSMKEVSYQLPAINLYMVQGGVYSSKASADKKVNDLKSKRYAAEVIQEDGKYMVYLGMASKKENGLSLIQLFRTNNQQVIMKEKQLSARSITLHVPQSTNEQSIGLASKLEATESELITLLTTLADEGFKNGKSSSITVDKLTGQHQKLLEQGAALKGLLPEEGKGNLQKSLNELAGAVNAARQFIEDPNQGYLFQLQGSLIRYYDKERVFRSGNFS